MKYGMAARKLTVAAGAAAMFLVGAMVASPPPAVADESHTDNPWAYQMTDDTAQGMVITGSHSLTQIVEIRDYLGQPIFVVNTAGGAAVLGDNLSVFAGDDIFNPVVQIRPDGGIMLGKNGPVMYSSHGAPGACFVRPSWSFTDDGRIYFCGLVGGPVRVSGTSAQR